LRNATFIDRAVKIDWAIALGRPSSPPRPSHPRPRIRSESTAVAPVEGRVVHASGIEVDVRGDGRSLMMVQLVEPAVVDLP
jgi:hypothetical protein